jgi:4-hydroxymandelate synthase
MDGARLSHVHMYVGDASQAAFYYCRAFGFQVAAESADAGQEPGRRSVLLAQDDIRLLLTSTTDPEDPVARYVAAHGDGVADIAIAVPDVADAFHAAVKRGALPIQHPLTRTGPAGSMLSAAVGGFGDVIHTLVERDAPMPDPGLVPTGWVPAEPGTALLRNVDHFAVCVPVGELDKTVSQYQQVFAFEEAYEEFIEVGKQAMLSKVVRDPVSGITFTVIEPDPRRDPGQIDDFLRRHGGGGVQHVAFGTADIGTAVRRLAERGVEFLDVPDSYYDKVQERVGDLGPELELLRYGNILADRDDEGLLLQIFTKSPYARRTLFLELIERRGARTFGSNNIKGLYEAVAREERKLEAGGGR